MTDWLESLSIPWLIVVVFAGTFLVTGTIYLVVMRLATRGSGEVFNGISPGLLPPMGIIFALIVGFLVAGLWSALSDAQDAVDREASALRATELVAGASFPGATSARINGLIKRQIQDAATKEWPAMADQRATLTVVPGPLAHALHIALSAQPSGPAQATGQRELVSSLETALDARRQRIIVSRSSVNWVKWLGVVVLASLTLTAIALVHSGNRRTAALAMGIFASAVAVTLVLIASQARPFSGEFGIKPDVLLQVQPGAADNHGG